MLKLCKINACITDGILGLHLSRTPWDPYPWVSEIQDTSCAYLAGIRAGDTILEVNDFDIIGQKISELATTIRTHWNSGAREIQFLIWRNKVEQNAPNQQSLQKFGTCLQNIAQLLECPICLEVVKPPGWQCCNGHVLCNSCRARTTKCSICRVTLGPKGRCLLSDKLFTLLVESFPCNAKTQNRDPTKEQKSVTTRPIAAIKYIKRKSKQIVTIKVSSEVSENEQHQQQQEERFLQKDIPDGPSAIVIAKTKNYHCPTGKSCVNPRMTTSTTTTDPCRQLHSQWDVLTHLRRVHQLAVIQHYGTYGERIQVQLMNKSISCISIAPSNNGYMMQQPPAMITSRKTTTTTSVSIQRKKDEPPLVVDQILVTSAAAAAAGNYSNILSNRRTTTLTTGAGGEVHQNRCVGIGGGGIDGNLNHYHEHGIDIDSNGISAVELFFVARIPMMHTENENYNDVVVGDYNESIIEKGDGNGNVTIADGNERCAIFIWYCGDASDDVVEKNAKKFQAMIEFKRSSGSIVKWNGYVHPMTRTWDSIRCQKEFHELKFDVFSFFDIVIKLK